MLSLQYQKLKRKGHESALEWLDKLQTKAADCDYKEYDRELEEQFIHIPDDEDMISEILKELLVLEDIYDIKIIWYCYGPKK